MRQKLFTSNFLLLTLASLTMAISFYFMIALVPLFLTQHLMCNPGEAGIVISLFAITSILVRPVAGLLLDRIGRRATHLVAAGLFALLYFNYPFVATFTALLWLRMLHGLAWGALNSAAGTIIVDIVPEERRGEGIGYYGLGMTVAMAIAPLMATELARWANMSTAFWVAAAIALVGLVLILPLRTSATHQRNSRWSWSQVWFREAARPSLVMIAMIMPYGAIISFIGVYGGSLGIRHIGLHYMLLAIGLAFGRVISGRVYDRRGPLLIISISLVTLIVGLLFTGLFPFAWSYFGSALVLGFGFGILMSTLNAMANRGVAAHRRGAANSTFFAAFDLGIALGILLFGRLAYAIGYAGAFCAIAVAPLVGFVYFLWFVRRS